jgi:2-aminoadipate transaminase
MLPLRFASRTNTLQRSFIREVLKYTNVSGMVSLAGGLPDKNLFPIAQLQKQFLAYSQHLDSQLFQYAPSEGLMELREWVANYLQGMGLEATKEDIIIVSGAQQTLSLCSQAFLDEENAVAVEAPSYVGGLNAFKTSQASIYEVAMKENGIDLLALEACFKTYSPSLFYAIPNFQNPSGITYDKQTREGVAKLLEKYNVVLLEDDPYRELRYSGEAITPISAYAPKRSVYTGSFSKILMPGIRLGWIYAKEEIFEKLLILKQSNDLHSNAFLQQVLIDYFKDNDFNAHLEVLREIYSNRLNIMIDSLQTMMPKEITYHVPKGGMFVWLTIPNSIDVHELLEKCIQEKVIFIPGDVFYASDGAKSSLRLSFATSSEADIKKGVKALAKVLIKFINFH